MLGGASPEHYQSLASFASCWKQSGVAKEIVDLGDPAITILTQSMTNSIDAVLAATIILDRLSVLRPLIPAALTASNLRIARGSRSFLNGLRISLWGLAGLRER